MQGGARHENMAEDFSARREVLDASWMPFVYDARSDSLTFAQLPREKQRRAVFLDARFVADAPQSPPISLRSLPEDEIRAAAGPIHFIFHTGFCCSTLLAKAFDIPGVSMGLKEPSVLRDLALLWSSRGRRTPGASEALGLTLDLLSRPLAKGETQIVKANNLCNHLIPEVMFAKPDAKVLILYSNLDSFLRAIARRATAGRYFARQTYHEFSSAIPLDMYFAPDDLLQFTDMQMGALVWLMQARFFESIAARYGESRVRILNSDALLADPATVLTRLAAFYDLPLDAKQITTLANGPVFKEHAKHQGRAFDAEAYRAQHAEDQKQYGAEIASVLPWAHNLAARAGAPIVLPSTLLD